MAAADLGYLMRGDDINGSQEHFFGDCGCTSHPGCELLGLDVELQR